MRTNNGRASLSINRPASSRRAREIRRDAAAFGEGVGEGNAVKRAKLGLFLILKTKGEKKEISHALYIRSSLILLVTLYNIEKEGKESLRWGKISNK